jgi:hypothetical protein
LETPATSSLKIEAPFLEVDPQIETSTGSKIQFLETDHLTKPFLEA